MSSGKEDTTNKVKRPAHRSIAIAVLGVFILLAGIYRLVSLYQELNSSADEKEVVVEGGFLPMDVMVDVPVRAAPTLQSVSGTATPPMPTVDPAVLTQVVGFYGTPQPTVTPTTPPTPRPVYGQPERIQIPSINLDAPVVPATHRIVELAGNLYDQWQAPNKFAAGWQEGSAEIGAADNMVLVGHHNIEGKVFGDLVELKEGDKVRVSNENGSRWYVIALIMILEERGATPEQRADNAAWLYPTDDERLTLVTCWPEDSNTHRLIIVASAEN